MRQEQSSALGTGDLEGRVAYDCVSLALRAGYRHVDTAANYGKEVEVGRAIEDGGVPRDEVRLVTKVAPDTPAKMLGSIERSLTGLGVDHVDVLLLHWPQADGDVAQHGETVRDAAARGGASEIGVSNVQLEHRDAVTAVGTRPTMNQIPSGIRNLDAATVAVHRRRRIAIEAHSPIRAGRSAWSAAQRIASDRDCTAAQVVICLMLQNRLPVVAGSHRPAHIRSNIVALNMSLPGKETAQLSGGDHRV